MTDKMITIKNFIHSNHFQNNRFVATKLAIVDSDRNRHHLEGVTSVTFTSSDSFVVTDAAEVFAKLAEVMEKEMAVRIYFDEPAMFVKSLVVHTFDCGDFHFHGAGK